MATVVFDLDGTLADTAADLVAAANACFADLGHGAMLDAAADAATALRGGRAMLRLGFGRLGIDDAAAVDAQYQPLLDHYGRDLCRHTRLYPGAAEAVAALSEAGYRTAVCTNKPEALAQALMRALGARDWFASLVGADTLPVRKPDPAPFVHAVRLAGGDPARACLIGDTDTDLETARRAGVPSVLVTFGPAGTDGVTGRPDARLDRLCDLPALVPRLIGMPGAARGPG